MLVGELVGINKNIWKQSGTTIPPIDGNEIKGKPVLSSNGSKLFLPSTNISVDSSGNKEGSLQLYFFYKKSN
jgi:hypothetical protein